MRQSLFLLVPDAAVADDHGRAQGAVDHVGEEHKAEEEDQGIFIRQRGVFGEIPGTGQGQDEAGVHGNGDTPRPLATVAHLVEVMEFDVHGDGPGDEDDGQYDGDSHGKGKV